MDSFLRRLVIVAYGILGAAGLFAGAIWFGATHSGFAIFLTGVMDWLPFDRTIFFEQLEEAGIFSIGWGVGVTAWLVTGQQAATYLFSRVHRAWTLWRRRVLTSLLPVFKYLVVGLILIGLGALLVRQLWGLWTGAYDAGLIAGVMVGIVYSVSQTPSNRTRLDFLEANQRYLNDEEVSVFTETQKP
jgi:hypothetical protein